MKEPITQFDLEAAFKALDEIEIPKVRGLAPQRAELSESCRSGRKLKTDLLIEDYYNINDNNDLEQAQTERDAEVAKAKLARIEKIVDIDAQTADDLLPSYVGKVIVQCPQCMTMFYKNPDEIEYSEEDPTVANVGEICQHCGNDSGYTVIGKVDNITEEERDKYQEAEASVEETSDDEDTEDLNIETEETTEAPEEDLTDLDKVKIETEETETTEDNEVKESLNTVLNEEGNAAWKALSNKPRDLLAKLKADPDYAATYDFIFYGTDKSGDVVEIKKYHNDDKSVDTLKKARDDFFASNDKFDTVYVARYFKNKVDGHLEEAPMDIYTVYHNTTDFDDDFDGNLEESCKNCGKTDKELTEASDTVEDEVSDTAEIEADTDSESIFDTVTELDEDAFNSMITNYLTDLYENVDRFEVTACTTDEDESLVITGVIHFTSGNEKETTFHFVAKEAEDIHGTNPDFSDDEEIYDIEYGVEDTEDDGKKLIMESLSYHYSINGTPVSGKVTR